MLGHETRLNNLKKLIPCSLSTVESSQPKITKLLLKIPFMIRNKKYRICDPKRNKNGRLKNILN